MNHVIKLILRKKKQNALLIIQLFVSFIILFIIFSWIFNLRKGYDSATTVKKDDVVVATINFQGDHTAKRDLLLQKLEQNELIEDFALSSQNAPFSKYMVKKYASYKELGQTVEVISTSKEFGEVLDLDMLEGKWFSSTDGQDLAIITRSLKYNWFGEQNAIGKHITLKNAESNTKIKVVGVVDDYKHFNDYNSMGYGIIVPIKADDYINKLVVKKKEFVSDYALEKKLYADLVKIDKDWQIEIEKLDKLAETQNSSVTIPLLVFSLIGGFLILNIIFGISGILFMNISKREKEVGIRRAIGANRNKISGQFMTEMMVVSSIAILISIIIAIQFPILKVFDIASEVYINSIIVSTLSIYIIGLICSFIPSKKASYLEPKEILG
ncbi:FtsX-like permease family protein [Aquimarina gracilis]|uniref:FtsX-like permease family protein n=1 Tax=Aquimarina gracilis TaxID=874422 RepID=A0ABU5ZU89_9FLAO|nr:FtsX-like permease family protein [Aquimarina gracilis]MEB3345650.1 FtsX-like permease family protein [Aquimarina gracilis]